MVSLTNQARLLAAQAFNKRILEEKARAKKAEIVAEAQKQIARSTRRLVVAKANARNPVEASRIQASINQVLKSSAEKTRVAKITSVARRELSIATQRAFGASAGRVGILTGFVARRDSSGRIQGISKKESATRKNTKRLLLTEIRNQQKIRDRETDLERFLKNERSLSGFSGAKAFATLKRQIAKRKARGLSKTPAQKKAFFRLQEQEDLARLSDRNKRKRGRGLTGGQITDPRITLSRKRSEAGRAFGLGSSPFADPVFQFGGRTKAEQRARGGTFGRRIGGQSASDQIAFLQSTRERTTGARIDFAQSLLSGNLFGSSFDEVSSGDLLDIIGSQTKDKKTGAVSQVQFAPRTFEQELRADVGFFTTEAVPVTKPKLTRAGRAKLVATRKAEDFAIATESREQIATARADTASAQRRNQDDLSRISANLLVSNTRRGRAIERQNALAPPRVSRSDQFTLGGIGVSQQGSPFGTPRQISFADKSRFDDGRGSIAFGGQTGLTRGQAFALASDRRRQAEGLTAQNRILRGQVSKSGLRVAGGSGFGSIISGFASQQQARKGRQLTVSVSERLSISGDGQTRITRRKLTDAELRKRIASGISVPQSDFNRLRPKRPSRKKTRKKSSKKRSSSSSKTRSSGFKSSSGRTSSSSGSFDFGSTVRKGVSAAKFLGTLATGGNPFPKQSGTRTVPLPSARSALNALGGFQI